MIRLPTYAAFSLLATASAAYYAFSSREQFSPAMVYLSTSKICFVLLLNTGLVTMCVAWQLARRLFLGSLREAKVERLNEQSWREVIEILFAVTIFWQDFSVSFLAMVAALLLVKALHWPAQKRAEYIETTPPVPLRWHIRIVSLVFLLTIDCLFLSNSLRSLIQKREASVAIFFSFEYMILATSTVSTFVKYIFYVSCDMLMEGQWEKKAVYTFYLELISDLVHLSLYMLFSIAIFLNYGVLLHLIRELDETFRNLIRIADYVRYRKITSNMNERFPDATSEELDACDATCIICLDEMTTAKKLLCGHLFHVHCLRSWLKVIHTCPACSAPIIPADNGRAAAARQHGAQAGVQPGTGTPSAEGAPGENMSRRQAKLEAAAAAASLYGRSFVYPPANTLNRSSPLQPTSSTPQSEASSSSQSQKDQDMQFRNSSDGLVPLPFNANGAVGSGTSTRDLENSLLKAQENFIMSQIEKLKKKLEDEIVDHVEKLDEADRKLEEVGMVNKKLTSASIHSLPSRFRYSNKRVVISASLLGLTVCILIIGAFDLPFNQSLGIRREDENTVLNKFGWSHGRSLMAVENSDMISVDLRKMTGSGQQQQQQHWYSHISSKYQEEATEMQNGTVKPHQQAHMSHRTTVGLSIASVLVTVLVLGIVVWVLLLCNRRKRLQQKEPLELSGGMGPRRFQLCELVTATSNFADANRLGEGGFGPVYKGYLRNQDCHVAIKVLSKKQASQQQSEQGLREFKAEVKVMAQLRHRNIINLVGWCECDSQQRLLLVYELMAQGSLDKHLYGPEEILTWQQRYKIVLGLGSALLYLHRDCEKCIVHGDIKPANVMLDMSYNAKLGDFGLARLVEHGEEPRTTQVVAGTPGYVDPEFIANRWPRAELDVYSFGVVLLEVACGKRPASRQPNGASSLLAWAIRLYDQGMILDAADQRLNGEFDQQQMERVLITGLWCAHRDSIQRPSIEQAMDVLRSADAELPVVRALYEERHIRAMEEQAYGDLPVEDRPVHAVTTSTYFTSKDSVYLLAQE